MFCVTPDTIWSSTPSRGRKRATHSSRNFPYATTLMPYSFPHLASAPTKSNVSEPQKIPIIGINTTSEGFDATVGINDKEGIKLIVRHLAKLGHRNLLYLYESFSSTLGFSSFNRISGFQEACDVIDGLTARTLAVQKGDSILDAAISEIMAQDNPPTALCFHQDSQAIPLFFRLQRSGLSVPGDISVTGFDDSTFAKEAELTTVRQRPYDMAVDAAQKALALIEGQPIKEPFETFPVQLQVRGSTAKPRATPLL